MQTPSQRWWHRQTTWPTLTATQLAEHKQGQTVTVLIPARNEQDTVAGVVAPLVDRLRRAGLVDEVLVVDSGSTDRTAAVAAAAGAEVLEVPAEDRGVPLTGKGAALWWGMQHATGDLVVFLDADVAPSRAETVVALLTPLLMDAEVCFVKAAFDRPLTADGLLRHGSGGRVTELLARPLLNTWWPELAGFVQPLAGELAARRSLLAQLPFATGYGLEIAMLIDVWGLLGLPAMAQVDIGVREHRHHSDAALGRMSAEVLAAAVDRRTGPAHGRTLAQFHRGPAGFEQQTTEVRSGFLPAVGGLVHAWERD